MTATVWTNEDCDICEAVKERLINDGYNINEIDASELIKGIRRDIDTMAQLASQNMRLPVVRIYGTYIDVDGILGNKI